LRAFSNIPFELGPGVKFSVSVYICSTAEKKYLDETENPIEKHQVWLPQDDQNEIEELGSSICKIIQASRFLYPDENSVLGSAFLGSCWRRKMTMVCRFCSPVPQMSTKGESRSDEIREYNFDGIHIAFLLRSAELVKDFHLDQLDNLAPAPSQKRGEENTEGSRAKKARPDLMLDSLTVAQLRAATTDNLAGTLKQSTKKTDVVAMLKKYFGV
uniref:SAP domain-containing protein n=1 Tax=Heligmosomoides polygyrus TaxID=6339 RepID=A0A183FP93_HELPZ